MLNNPRIFFEVYFASKPSNVPSFGDQQDSMHLVLQCSVTCTCPNLFIFFVSSVLKFSDPFICILYLILSMDYFDVFLTT